MLATIEALQGIKKECMEKKPAFAISALKWDEAEQKVAVDLGKKMKTQQRTSGWKTLLSRQRLVIGWSDGSTAEYPVLRPPVPMLDTSADCVDSGLEMRVYPKSFLHKVSKLVAEILALAEVAFDLSGTDGAYGNLRYLAHVQGVAHAKVLADPGGSTPVRGSILCQNHRNALVEASATSLLGLGVVNAMFSMASFLRMGGHFTRLGLASDVVSGTVIFRKGRPPKDAVLYSEEMLDFVLANHKAEREAHKRAGHDTRQSVSKANSRADNETRKADSKFRKSAQEYYKFVYYIDGQDVHFCVRESCCNNYDLSVCTSKAATLRREVLICGQPERPEQGKWTKLGAALDWQLQGRPNGFLKRVWKGVFGRIEVQYT